MSSPPAMIPDEIVEKGAKAMWDAMCWKATWEEAPERDKRNWRDDTRAALEAVVPDLTAAARAETRKDVLWEILEAMRLECHDINGPQVSAGVFSGGTLTTLFIEARDAYRASLKPKATGEG